MFRQNTSSPKTWSLTCCKKWTWRRDVSKFGELILWVAYSTRTLLSTRIKAFHIFPHTVASNVVFHQKYVLSEKDCLCPVIKIVHKYLMPQNFGNILFHLPRIQNHWYQTYLKHIVFHLKWGWSRTLIIKQPIMVQFQNALVEMFTVWKCIDPHLNDSKCNTKLLPWPSDLVLKAPISWVDTTNDSQNN